jgi:ribosomal protein L7/L12
MSNAGTFIAVGAGLLAAGIAAMAFARKRGDASGPASRLPPPPDLAALDDDAFRARVLREIEAGRKIEAIRIVRERTRLGLADAKALVDALAAGDDGVDLALARQSVGDDVAQVALDDPELAAQLVLELAAGRKLEAIKLLRERTGLGLKEAKDAIEALEGDAPAPGASDNPPHWDRL